MVIEILVVHPGVQEVVIQDMTDFVQNYYRVIGHYHYDPLWRPGVRFTFEDCQDLHIIRFTTPQILDLKVLRVRCAKMNQLMLVILISFIYIYISFNSWRL